MMCFLFKKIRPIKVCSFVMASLAYIFAPLPFRCDQISLSLFAQKVEGTRTTSATTGQRADDSDHLPHNRIKITQNTIINCHHQRLLVDEASTPSVSN